MKYGDIIEIKWLDSYVPNHPWVNEATFDFESHDKHMELKSIGHFIRKTKIAMYICQTVWSIPDKDSYNPWGHLISIPNKAILSIKML